MMTHPAHSILVVLPAKQLRLDCDPRGFGGIYKAALSQVQALRSAGADVTVLTASKPFFEDARREGADCHFHPHWHSSFLPLLNPSCWLQAWRVRSRKPRAALHHSGRTWPWAKILLRGIPGIGILHTGSLRRTKHFRHQFALSSRTLAALEADPAHSGYVFRRIKNGLLGKGTPPAATRPDIPAFDESRPLRLGHLGRVCHDKGIDILLRAVAALKHRGLAVTLRIVGEKPPEYLQLARNLGVSDIVSFQDWIDDPEQFYASIDVFCLASRSEPFGLVVLEAMSRGLPVIASACEGPSDIIVHGVSGLLFPPEDADGLADLIGSIHQEPALCHSLGDAARLRIAEEYSPEAVGASILHAIDSLPDRAGNPPPPALT